MGLILILIGLISTVIAGAVSFLAYVNWKNSKYFEEQGVPFLGMGLTRMLRMINNKLSFAEVETVVYSEALKTGSSIVGFTDNLVVKSYYITDLDLARNIYVKDFEHFVNRRKFATQKVNAIFLKMLIGMENEPWKGLRSKLSPTFTTGKIRRMFGIFETSSKRMCDYLENIVGPSGSDFDLCQVYSKYAMDVIASCAFGVDSKSFDCEPGKRAVFDEMGQRLQFQFNAKLFIKFIITMVAPKLAETFGLETFDTTPIDYFSNVVKQVMKRRRETGERQEDFLQLMLDAQEGLLKAEENSKETLEVMTGSESAEESKNSFVENGHSVEKLVFDDESIIANSILFMLGGFDTLQSLLIFAAYQLALDQDVQEKLYQEVTKYMEANDGKLTYDCINEMSYLDLFINETLRFFSPASRTERVCTKDYTIPGTKIVIEKGTLVAIPVHPVHHDPKYFENPEKFDPERFLPENKSKRHPYSFAPFGHGPRNCIGMRFALTEAKTVIATLVKTFKLQPCTKTLIPMKFSNTSTLKPAEGIMWLNICPRN